MRFALLLLTISWSTPGLLWADEKNDVVGVLSVETQGVSETAGEMFEASVEEGLMGSGFELIRSVEMAKTLATSNYVTGCHFGPCLDQVRLATGVRLILVARIYGEGTSYSFVISLIDTRTGQHTSQVAERCDVCTVEEAILTATSSVIAAMTGTGEASVDDPDAGPAGAAILIDLREYRKRAEARRVLWKRTGWGLIGAGAIVGVAGLYVQNKQSEPWGYSMLGGGVGAVLSGASMLLVSKKF